MKELSVYSEKPLTSDAIDRLYTPSSSSPDGSNRKRKEEITMAWWRDFIVNLEEEGNLKSLLAFLTGLDEIPPLGFECKGYITFRHREDMEVNDATIEFPLINTCSLELRLPVLESYELFVQRFKAAMTINTFTAI
ncbi:uncharacterized protein LOC132756211 [Ruditapes philippinarum]|uniref:uncharacterized protein LOC132756211 n=1 Tax=Ruditapes philippinarum TaxID=129788 RepID=UPI00295C1B69|nr:uncharacterized protein LOC132756211 [Ruditapes philippinarum]